MPEEEADRARGSPVSFINRARVNVLRFECFDKMTQLVVRGMSGVREGLRYDQLVSTKPAHWCILCASVTRLLVLHAGLLVDRRSVPSSASSSLQP